MIPHTLKIRLRMLCIPLFLFALVLNAKDEETFPPELNGSMMPYDFAAGDTVVPWDSTMRPVGVVYLARHGARYLTSEKKFTELKDKLIEAGTNGKLTDKGMEFLDVMFTVDSVTDGNWGGLNALGVEEEDELASQMARMLPDLMKDGSVAAKSTNVPRVVMSMYEYCHGLADNSGSLEVNTSEGKKYNTILRFFDTDTTYVNYLKDGVWLPEYEAFVNQKISPKPGKSLFSEDIGEAECRKLTMDMYNILRSLPAAGIEWNPQKWFTLQEYRDCWEASNLKHYLQRSVNYCSDIAAKAAVPLLNSIIETADKTVKVDDGSVADINLFFGHAETLMPLLALMRVPGCYLPDSDPMDVAEQWKDYEVSPLGANLMIVLLKDKYDDTLACVRLNGQWLSFDLSLGSTQILSGEKIRWEILKGCWRAAENY